MVIYPQFLLWDTTGGVHALATSSTFGGVRIRLTDPTTNFTPQVAADFGASLRCFVLYVFTSRKSDRIKILGFSHVFYNVKSYPHWQIVGMFGIGLFPLRIR